MSLEAEIRARRKKRPRNEDRNFWTIAFGIALTLVLGIFISEKIHTMKQNAYLEQRRLEAQQRQYEAEIERHRAAAATRQYARPAQRAAVTTESGRSYYAPEPSAPAPRQKSNIERYDEALAWMEASRQTQRQIDGSGRYRVNGSQNVVSAGNPSNSSTCKALKQQREAIHAAMRRGYESWQGEEYRRQLNQNFRNWCDHDCGSC